MKNILKILTCLIFTVFLTGCSMAGLDPRTLISPPTSNQDQQAIYDLMNISGENKKFVFPKTGDYRSAVIIKNLDRQSGDEALGFTESAEGGIDLTFMSEVDGKWQIKSIFNNSGIQVNKVLFADLDGDKVDEVIIGWGVPQSLTATITIYKYRDGLFEEYLLDQPYNDFIVDDFDGNNTSEIFTATIAIPAEGPEEESKNASGRIFEFDDGPELLYECDLNNTVSLYNSISVELLYNSVLKAREEVIVLEGVLAEGGYITQLLTIDNNELISPLMEDDILNIYNFFHRYSVLPVQSQDINDDFIIEFPQAVPIVETNDASKLNSYDYYVDWMALDAYDYDSILIRRTIISTEDNFIMEIPTERNIVIDKINSTNYSVKENSYDNYGNIIQSRDLFNINIFTTTKWENSSVTGMYTKLFTTDEKIIAVSGDTVSNAEIIDTIEVLFK